MHPHYRSLLLLLTGLLASQTPSADAAPPLAAVPGAVQVQSQVVATSAGKGFTEGPVLDAAGRVLFTDIPNERILRYDPTTGETQILRHPSGGANGLAFDAQKRLICCEGKSRRLTRLEQLEDPQPLTTLADSFQGKKLNSPNDLCLDAEGGIYFTDPRYGPRADLEQEVEAVYYLPAQGPLRRLMADLIRPNGIALSHDQKTLFVADNANKKIWAYDIVSPGNLANPRVFAELSGAKTGGADGIKVDALGRVWAAGQNSLWVFAASGQLQHSVSFEKSPTNVALADPEGKVVYVTSGNALFRLDFSPPAPQDAASPASPGKIGPPTK